jgi:3-oxoacyl-[acyl-carrier-protein] synthase II
MTQKVLVTGAGIITSIGENLKENIESIKSGKSGLSHIEILPTVHQGSQIVGEIKKSNNQLGESLGLGKTTTVPRNTLLALIAAKEAVANADIHDFTEYSTGIILGTTAGGMDQTELFYRKRHLNTDFIKTHNCGTTTEYVADYLGIEHFATTISTACSSAANAALLGARLIQSNVLDRVIVGGTDALSKFTINGFNALMILDGEACKPFSASRKGLNLGEGAAFIVLESDQVVKKSNKKPVCALSGYSNKNDAFHHTATSTAGDGPFLCMEEALKIAGLKPGDIDYINLHGTGTENNDMSEAVAIKRLFSENIPPSSSTKGFTGHTLGAAGGVESVFSIIAITEKMIMPNINFVDPIEIEGFQFFPSKELVENVEIKHVMSNSFGFGANDTSLIFSKV